MLWHASAIEHLERIQAEGLQPNTDGYVAFAVSRVRAVDHGAPHAWREFCLGRPAVASLFAADLDDVLTLDGATLCAGVTTDLEHGDSFRYQCELRVAEAVPPRMLRGMSHSYDMSDDETYSHALEMWLLDAPQWLGGTLRDIYTEAERLHARSGVLSARTVAQIAGLRDGQTFTRPKPTRGRQAGTVTLGNRAVPLTRFRAL